ncbi:MAG: phosphoglucosamine mutase [Catalinimonas sp.]
MSLIKSISGIRGTIGGKPGEGLTPPDVVKYTAAYGTWLLAQREPTEGEAAAAGRAKVVIGRDARTSGEMVTRLVVATLQSLGIDVVDLGLSTTPTVELGVTEEEADGGLIITASHNPAPWNALKMLNADGEFLTADDGAVVLDIAESDEISYVEAKHLGSYRQRDDLLRLHIERILALPLVDRDAIAERDFRVAVDAVNSTGGIAVPMLLEALGVNRVEKFFCEPDGQFPHNPEPLPENMTFISNKMERGKFDLGIVVDPDVDRLAFLTEDGTPFGEEYTLVAVADYVLKQNGGGNTVSNLSSTQALRDVTERHGGEHFASAVGEVNVVQEMKAQGAVIGGEGNGGVIYPPLHYGRDALVGIALFLTHLAQFGKRVSMLRGAYPSYYIAKNKIELEPNLDLNHLLAGIQKKYERHPISTVDGVKIHFDGQWVHLRRSNTEPVIRIYAEADSMVTAENLTRKLMADLKDIITEKA